MEVDFDTTPKLRVTKFKIAKFGYQFINLLKLKY